MVIDTSAILAVLLGEDDGIRYLDAVMAESIRHLSAVSALECAVVLTVKKGDKALSELDLFLSRAAIETVAFDQEQARLARRAFARYGKGRHPAALNFGDCCVYALAKYLEEPLLFKGADFSRTDVMKAQL